MTRPPKCVLDTNVVSALRVRDRHPSVEAWVASVEIVDQFLTAMSVAELERGVVAQERRDAERAPLDDALIAATAQAREMVVVTRNARDVAPLGIEVHDPWVASIGSE